MSLHGNDGPRLLAAEPGFEIAGHCASAGEALRLVAKTTVEVVVLDYEFGRTARAWTSWPKRKAWDSPDGCWW